MREEVCNAFLREQRQYHLYAQVGLEGRDVFCIQKTLQVSRRRVGRVQLRKRRGNKKDWRAQTNWLSRKITAFAPGIHFLTQVNVGGKWPIYFCGMKAMIYKKYGTPEVLHLAEVAKPAPKPNEVLIRVYATAANSGDVVLRRANPWGVRLFFGLFRPRINILGGVFSGVVESVGAAVTKYKAGDLVFGATGMKFGAYAEYLCLPESGVFSAKPTNLNHRQASTIPFGGTAALHFIKKAKIQPGQRVLVYGASGALGTAAVQLAKYYGAHVTAVCSAANFELMRMIGADRVIDYRKEDFSASSEQYDVIFESVNKAPFDQCVKSLAKGGTLILAAAMTSGFLRGTITSMTSDKKVLFGVIKQNEADITFLKDLVEKGHYKPVVDRTYNLEQMAEAHAYVERGHKRGNVAISVVDQAA